MDNPWIIWPLVVLSWIIFVAATFAYFEKRYWNSLTLSRFTYDVTQRFPLLIFFIGMSVGLVLGVLSTHFFWHWCPPGSLNIG